MAEITAAIITSSTAVCLAAIPCMMKIHKKEKIHEQLDTIHTKAIHGLQSSDCMAYSILTDIGLYFKKFNFRHNTLCFSEFVSGKPQNMCTCALICYVSTRIDEFLAYVSRPIYKRRNQKLVCFCYELLLKSIVSHIRHETSEDDVVYKYNNSTFEHIPNIEHMKLVNDSIQQAGILAHIHLVKNIQTRDSFQNQVLWSSSDDIFKHGKTIEEQIQSTKAESMIQLSILNRWDTNEHNLESIRVNIGNNPSSVFFVKALDNKKHINVIASILLRDYTDIWQKNCKLVVHALYKNEHNFLMKVNSATMVIDHVIFYNNHVSEASSHVTSGIIDQKIYDVISDHNNGPSTFFNTTTGQRTLGVRIRGIYYDLLSIVLGDMIYIFCYKNWQKDLVPKSQLTLSTCRNS